MVLEGIALGLSTARVDKRIEKISTTVMFIEGASYHGLHAVSEKLFKLHPNTQKFRIQLVAQHSV